MGRTFGVVSLALALNLCAFAQCNVPHYRQGLTLVNSKNEIITNISIRLQDFAPNRLVCLARSLRRRYQDRQSIVVSIFSSHEAATHSIGLLRQEYTSRDVEMFVQNHAKYSYEAKTGDDYILLTPDPMIGDPSALINTKFDLSASTIPPCNLRIGDRCLLAFDHIRVPNQQVPTTVVVSGQIDPDGSVSQVRIANAESNPSDPERAFAHLAVQNLKSWRFERMGRTDALRIDFSIEHVVTPLEHGVNVKFKLPDEVTIQTGPRPLSR
jgi:hypothetical protein